MTGPSSASTRSSERGDPGDLAQVVPEIAGRAAEPGEGGGDGRVVVGALGRDREREARVRQRLGDAEADALLAAGDERDRRHAARSRVRMWSATRSARAAMVSAGFTAAEVGRKLASTTKRLGWSRARQKGSSTLSRRVGADARGAALVRGRAAGRRGATARAGSRRARSTAFSLRDQAAVGRPVRAPPVEQDALALEAHAALGVGQVLADGVDVDRMARDPGATGHGERRRGGEDAAGDLAEQLHVAERRAVRAAGEVEVVDHEASSGRPQSLRRRGSMASTAEQLWFMKLRPTWSERLASPAGRSRGRAQQQHRRVDRPGATSTTSGAARRLALPSLVVLDRRDPRPSGAGAQPGDPGAGHERDVRVGERVGEAARSRRPSCAPRGVGEGVPGRSRRAASQRSGSTPSGRAEGRDAGARQPGADVGDGRLVGHRRVRVGAANAAARSGPGAASPRTW